MPIYKYETHCHTSETSRCSAINGTDLVGYYHSLGYSGLCITDHFFNGNTTVPRDIAWDKRVEMFTEGYNNAAVEGNKLGINVFFGWEYSHQGADFLTYGLSKEWLLSNPDLMSWSLNEYLDRARSDGAFIVHAHPFREAGYIPMIHLNPGRVDAVEIYNASMTDAVNQRAQWYAESYGLKLFAGSDMHSDQRLRLCGIESEVLFSDISEFTQAFKRGSYNIFDFHI
ncbi:MAG: PHP domain-containing protein [Eubacteriales bacterium]|jgi:predicted metal-dependent phosphoesterase TrpH|nr:PHP domain-containing protein [Eubacteriales bacterium]